MGKFKYLGAISLIIFQINAYALDEIKLRTTMQNGEECKYLDPGAYQYADRIWQAYTEYNRCLREEAGRDKYPQRSSMGSEGGQKFKENLSDFKAQTNTNISWAQSKNEQCKKNLRTYSFLQSLFKDHLSEPKLCAGERERIGQLVQEMEQNKNSMKDAINKREAYIAENERLGEAAQSNLDSIAGNDEGIAKSGFRIPSSIMEEQEFHDAVEEEMFRMRIEREGRESSGLTTVRESY